MPYTQALQLYSSPLFFIILAILSIHLLVSFIFAIIHKRIILVLFILSILLVFFGGFLGKMIGIQGDLGVYEKQSSEYIFNEFSLKKYFNQYDLNHDGKWDEQEKKSWELTIGTSWEELKENCSFSTWFNQLCIAPQKIQSLLGHNLPFQLYLDEFVTNYYAPIPRLKVMVDNTKIQETFNVLPNKTYTLPWTKYEITILNWNEANTTPEKIALQIKTSESIDTVTIEKDKALYLYNELSLQYFIEKNRRVKSWKSQVYIQENNTDSNILDDELTDADIEEIFKNDDSNNANILKYSIAVNHPLKYKGYNLYQSSYDIQEGKAKKSILSVVYDPGIPFVYAGFFLMIVTLLIQFCILPFLSLFKFFKKNILHSSAK